MEATEYRRLDEYFDHTVPLRGRFEDLCDTDKYPDHTSEDVDEAVVNLVSRLREEKVI